MLDRFRVLWDNGSGALNWTLSLPQLQASPGENAKIRSIADASEEPQLDRFLRRRQLPPFSTRLRGADGRRLAFQNGSFPRTSEKRYE